MLRDYSVLFHLDGWDKQAVVMNLNSSANIRKIAFNLMILELPTNGFACGYPKFTDGFLGISA